MQRDKPTGEVWWVIDRNMVKAARHMRRQARPGLQGDEANPAPISPAPAATPQLGARAASGASVQLRQMEGACGISRRHGSAAALTSLTGSHELNPKGEDLRYAGRAGLIDVLQSHLAPVGSRCLRMALSSYVSRGENKAIMQRVPYRDHRGDHNLRSLSISEPEKISRIYMEGRARRLAPLAFSGICGSLSKIRPLRPERRTALGL
jgi:hypothetical protein